MKCILYAPFVDWEDGYYAEDVCLENPGLAILSAVLQEEGCDVIIHDGNIELLHDHKEVEKKLSNINFLGLSIDSAAFNNVNKWLFKIRRKYPSLAIAIGDYAITTSWRSAIKKLPAGIAICVGEGEIPLREWAKKGFANEKLKEIPGFAVMDTNEEISYIPQKETILDLDTLPIMDRQIFHRVRTNHHNTMVLIGSRGCPYSCLFCSRPAFSRLSKSPKWRERSPENIRSEVELLNEKYGITNFYFFDDHFLGDRQNSFKRITEFTNVFRECERKYKFRIALRADTIESLGLEGIQSLKNFGVERVFLGIEAFSTKQLHEIGKRIYTAQTNHHAINLLENNGILAHCGFINFTPKVSLEDLIINGEGLVHSRQGAFFRHFNSRLFYGPGSKMAGFLPANEKMNDYCGCEKKLPPAMKHILQRLDEAYLILRASDLLMEKVDFCIFRCLNNEVHRKRLSDELFSKWIRTRTIVATRNGMLYRKILENKNNTKIENHFDENLHDIKMLEKEAMKFEHTTA